LFETLTKFINIIPKGSILKFNNFL